MHQPHAGHCECDDCQQSRLISFRSRWNVLSLTTDHTAISTFTENRNTAIAIFPSQQPEFVEIAQEKTLPLSSGNSPKPKTKAFFADLRQPICRRLRHGKTGSLRTRLQCLRLIVANEDFFLWIPGQISTQHQSDVAKMSRRHRAVVTVHV